MGIRNRYHPSDGIGGGGAYLAVGNAHDEEEALRVLLWDRLRKRYKRSDAAKAGIEKRKEARITLPTVRFI